MKGKPRGRPYQKGQSGNPFGRPKKGDSVAEIMRQILEDTDPKTRRTNRELLARMLVKKAIEQEDVPAARTILERVDGRVALPITLPPGGGSGLGHITEKDPEKLAIIARNFEALGHEVIAAAAGRKNGNGRSNGNGKG